MDYGDFCMDPDGCYTFNLYDTYGDMVGMVTLDAGAFGVYTVQAGTQSSTSNCVLSVLTLRCLYSG